MFITKTIIRGSKVDLLWEFKGTFSEGNIFFTAKKDFSLTGDRLINILCERTYDETEDKTVIKAKINSEDTQGIIYETLVYDLTLNLSDGNELTIARGYLKIKFDVRTQFDGTPIDPEKYVPVKRSDYEDGDYIKAKIINGEMAFVGYKSLRNGIFDVDINGDLMPKENPDFDEAFEIDDNGDIMPVTEL